MKRTVFWELEYNEGFGKRTAWFEDREFIDFYELLKSISRSPESDPNARVAQILEAILSQPRIKIDEEKQGHKEV